MTHIPVLLNEVIQYLNVFKGQKFVDATVGGGGHTREILRLNSKARVLGIDLDQTSLDKLREQFVQNGLDQRCTLVHGNYKNIDKFINETKFGKIDGIILDLGFSSFQVDESARGFSFQSDGPLDMRYDQAAHKTAKEVVNKYYEKELEKLISEYGEEKFSKRIAHAIVKERQQQTIETTADLVRVVKQAIPAPVRFKANDSLRRVFQALRIEVNSELDNLKEFLPKALAALSPNGRLAVISFHSLEDRIVKEFFNQEAKDCVCPPEFPTCVCDKSSSVRILTRKPVVATEQEQRENTRSKSAKLRVVEKIKN